MLKSNDVRYKADGPLTATVGTVLLPLTAVITRPTADTALIEAKRLVAQLTKEAGQTGIVGGNLTVCDFATAYRSQSARLKIEQASKKEVTLECQFFAVLAFDSSGDFWSRAEIIARHLDFLRRFCQVPREKDIEVFAERARFFTEQGAETGERVEAG